MVDLQAVITQDDSWQPIDLTTLPDQPPIEPNLAGTGLIYPGKRHVFSGPPESAKTLAAYCILIQIARTGGTGILIDFEMGAYDARQRLRELGAATDEIGRIHYLEPETPATATRVTALVDLRPDIVVVDAAAGAYQLQGLDDNKRGDVEKISGLYVTLFWRAGIATILIDHVVKNTENRGKFVIGSERKLGSADVHLGFETITPISRGTSGHYKIVTHKDRGGYLKRGHIADLKLSSDPDTNAIAWKFTEPEQTTGDTGYFRPTHLMEKVSVHLELRDEPATRTAIAEALGGRRDYILKAIAALVAEGYADETDGPNRAKLVSSTKSYRENDESASTEHGSTMRAEPRELLSGQATKPESANFAQPCGGSVVPGGSRVVPGTDSVGGSRSSPPLRGEPGYLTHPHGRNGVGSSAPEPLGWFDEDGYLADTYLDSIAPDDDIDWGTT